MITEKREPQYRCQRCQKIGTEAELSKYFCSDIPVTCYVARESMKCYVCEETYDDMNDWVGEPEYDGQPGPGAGTCRECTNAQKESEAASKYGSEW